MFTMNAIKSIKSIRGNASVLMKRPILAEMGKTGHSRRSGTFQIIAGSDAMTAAKAWLVANGRKALGELGKQNFNSIWDNVHVCVGGGNSAAKETAAAKNHSLSTMTAGCSESQQSSVVRLFSSSFSINYRLIVSRVRSFSQFFWYGQMSSRCTALAVVTAGGLVQGSLWQHWVNLENDRRMMHDRMKMMMDYESYQQELIKQQKMATEAEALKKSLLWQIEDTKAIEDYSGEGYSEMNAALRCPSKMTDDTQVRVDAVIKAMAKLTSVQAPVYRRTDLPDSVACNIQVGVEYQDLGFMSTSRDQEQTAFFQGEYLFVINCVSGVDITEHAVTKDEAEVLYPPGTRFLIKSVKTEVVTSEDYDDEEVIVVAMDEVREAKQPTR